MSRDTRYSMEQPNTDVLRRMQLAQANPNPQGPEGSGPFLYAIYVYDLDQGRAIRQFGFDIPPSSIKEDSDFANDFAAAQEGGFWYDDRGVYFKVLQVSGNFGFRPTPKRVQQAAIAQNVRRSANQLVGAVGRLANSVQAGVPAPPEGEVTGQDRFRLLQNLFFFYADRKKYRDTASNTMMVWANFKKGEAYLCQPMRFGEDRSVPGGRVKTAYNFSVRLIAPLRMEVPPDYIPSPRNTKGRAFFLDKLKETANVIDATRRLIETTVDGSVDFGFDVVDAILRPADSVVELARSIVDGVGTIARFPLEVARRAHRSCVEAVAVLGTIAATDQSARRLAAEYSRLGRAFANILVPIKVFSRQDVNSPAQAYANRYRQRAGLGDFETDPPSTRNVAQSDTTGFVLGGGGIPQGERKVRVPRNLSIRGIAQQYLGSAGRWKEIAVLNGLQPPYVDPSGDGKTVLRPGQTIRIPAVPNNTEGQVFDTRDPSEATNEKEGYDFGRDLKIDLDTRSLVVDSRGDLAVSEGEENLIQAMNIKTWTQPGDLELHPWFGFSAEVGEGVTLDLLSRYHLELKTTLESDTRVGNIDSLSLKADGDILTIRANIVAKGKDDSVGLTVFLPSAS